MDFCVMKRTNFSDLTPGTRFRYNGRVYLKLRMNLARGEDQKRTVFPTETAVETFNTREPHPEGAGEKSEPGAA